MRPYTVIFSTATLDGRIASATGYSRLSCEEDFDFQHHLRASVDLVLVGAGTVLADDPRLTVRRVPGPSPRRGVVDGRLRVPPGARVFSGGGSVLITSRGHPREALEPYRRRGTVIVEAGRGGRVDLSEAWRLLWDMGVRRIMVEGGGTLNYSLLREGLVDEVIVTVAPTVFAAGVSVFNDPSGEGFDGEREKVVLALEKVRPLCGGHWVRLYYRVLEPKKPRA